MKQKDDPLWYKQAIIYQLHVKCFHDSDQDGIGDFVGLTKKLGHIQNLGCTAIWLQPFYPSPLKDDGYDIQDYCNIHPNYGTLHDFKLFLDEAHKRGLKVITELVINHTSDQHIWFQKSRRAKKGSKWRNYYVWSDHPDKYLDARIIFKDFETSNWAWDPVANAYYWHRFYSSQPDLNYDNPDVHHEIFKIVDFWMGMGVDGMRLDAIPYLYQREGTDCENLPETHAFLKKLRAYVDNRYSGRMLLAEANQWPEQASSYFGDEDECHMAFHFPVMPRLFMSMHMEDRFPIIDIMDQTPMAPEKCQWAMFLRNHDELTLEMVTDEERDYMYRSYAKDPRARINLGIRRRLAPLLENDRHKIELMYILLFSLPGSPIIYYGDEIGMGDNYYLGDRNGVRTPMQWNYNTNAGFSQANPQKLYLPLIIDPEYHHDYLNVENQEQTVSSLLRWMRNVIATRQQTMAFGRGTMTFVNTTNSKVLAFIRQYEEDIILVVANLSRQSQYVELELGDYAGFSVSDFFSQNIYATIKDGIYGLSLAHHGYYWLSLQKSKEGMPIAEREDLVELSVVGHWDNVLVGAERSILEKNVLPGYIKKCRWFRSKARRVKGAKIVEEYSIGNARLMIVDVATDVDPVSTYLMPLTFVSLEQGEKIHELHPLACLAKLQVGEQKGYLVDAIYDQNFREKLIKTVVKKGEIPGIYGSLKLEPTKSLKHYVHNWKDPIRSDVVRAEQSNTSIIYEDQVIFKLYRKLDEGINPDLELSRHLTENCSFPYCPKYLGAIEEFREHKPYVIATIQEYIPQGTDAWLYTLDSIKLFFEHALVSGKELETYQTLFEATKDYDVDSLPKEVKFLIGQSYLEMAAQLGQRTAEMHIAFASYKLQSSMAPEPFTIFYQKSLYQGIKGKIRRTMGLLKEQLSRMDAATKKIAEEIIASEKKLQDKIKPFIETLLHMSKIRVHGDFHLGQVLRAGNELYVLDFEGEPILSISERRIKRSALRDVAGMIRSFHYALTYALKIDATERKDLAPLLERYGEFWFEVVKKVYLHAYLKTARQCHLLVPEDDQSLMAVLEAFLINKAVYEVGYELQNRPDWIDIPLKGLLMLTRE